MYFGIFHHDSKASDVFHDAIHETGFVRLAILVQRTVGVQEAVIGGDEDIGSTELVCNDAHHVFQLIDCLATGSENILNSLYFTTSYYPPLDEPWRIKTPGSFKIIIVDF